MAKLFNRAKMTTSTTGSGTVTLDSASVGYQSFADAGVSNGDVVQYVIEEGGNFEIGTGTYSATGTSLTRSPTESSNSNAAISLSGAATVSITAVADDLNRLQNAGSDIVTVSASGAAVTGNLDVSSGVDVTGNITVTGTVDGRDVATDGTKLDGIETGATADQSAAEILTAIKTVDGSGSGLDADTLDGSHASAFLTGNQTITLSGDASGSGTTSIAVSLAADSVAANEIAANAVGASELNVTGNGTTLQFLRSDGDGTFTWATPTDTNTTYSAGSGLSLSGTTFSHTDTSSQSSVNNSGRTYIQDITLDTYGHVTGISSATETVTDTNTTSLPIENSAGTVQFAATDSTGLQFVGSGATSVAFDSTNKRVTISSTDTDTNTTYSAGSGLSLSGTTFSHSDTSSQASVNNSGRTYIQDITLDTYGHITGITSATETVTNTDTIPNDATITLSAGTNLSGGGAFTTDQSFNETITFNVSSTPSFTSATFGSGVTLSESGDRADLLQISSSTSGWGGLQIRNSSNEGRWSFMTDGSTAGIYDDENGDWHVQWSENAGTSFYYNGVSKVSIGNTYMEMAQHLDMNNYDIYGCDQLFHHGDTNTYMQFHAADQWRVVVGGTERLEVKNSSPHVLVTGDLNSTSDARLKENVEPITNALSDVTQLEGVSFDWKDTGTRGHGFIAQQVEPILPDVVQTDEETGIKSINYVGMIGHLVEAIKEQQEQIDALKKQLNG